MECSLGNSAPLRGLRRDFWRVLGDFRGNDDGLYVVIIEVFFYREVSLRDLTVVKEKDSMVMVGGILLILGVALAFTHYLVDAECRR